VQILLIALYHSDVVSTCISARPSPPEVAIRPRVPPSLSEICGCLRPMHACGQAVAHHVDGPRACCLTSPVGRLHVAMFVWSALVPHSAGSGGRLETKFELQPRPDRTRGRGRGEADRQTNRMGSYINIDKTPRLRMVCLVVVRGSCRALARQLQSGADQLELPARAACSQCINRRQPGRWYIDTHTHTHRNTSMPAVVDDSGTRRIPLEKRF
jgi:hypothetical protein